MKPPPHRSFGRLPGSALGLARMLACAAALAPVLIWAPARAAEGAQVVISADQEGLPVNPAVTRGYNIGNWMAVVEFRDALARVPAAALRFPGGNIGDEQDMDAASLDAFRSLLGLVSGGRELMVQTRVFAGRVDRKPANEPEDAANAVRLARERGLAVPFWEIGNEPDLYSVTRGDPTWTPERYCKVFRAQARAIKAVDAQAQVAGPAVSGADTAMAFLDRFVELCGDAVDVLTWHIYPTDGSGSEAAALGTISQVDASVRRLQALWRDPKRNPLGHGREVKLGVTEYGLSWRTDRPHFLADQVAALWAAEAALRLAESGVRVAHYFAYQGTGFHGLLDNAGVPRPTYYAFSMLGGLEGRFVKAASSHPALWAHAVKGADGLAVLLLNTLDQPLEARLEAAGWQLRQAQYFDAAIVDEEHPLAALPLAGPLKLPPRSMALLRLRRAP
jgi:hypothetical protein